MPLTVDHEGPIPIGEVKCDVEYTDDCHYMEDLGTHEDWTEQQFRSAALDDLGWLYDAPHRRWLCPSCQEVAARRRRPAALAAEAYPRNAAADITCPDR